MINLVEVMSLRKVEQYILALRNQHKRHILAFLAEKPNSSVQAIQKKMNLPQPIVSQHLATLRKLKLIEAHRVSKNIFYNVNSSKLESVQNRIASILE